MKHLTLLLFGCIACFLAFAQSPQSFQYQSIVRDGNGDIVVNQPVSFQVSLISGSATGTVMYVETHSATTNAFGLVTLAIGEGSLVSGSFSGIDWPSAPHFIKVEVDITGGTAYVDMGTTQLLSVPYALNSKTSEDAFSGNYSDLSGVPTDVSTFNNDVGYITNPNDADADPANELQVLSVSNDTLFLSNGGFVSLSGYSDTLWRMAGNDIHNTNSGKVGIGTTTPPGKLVVQGDSSMADTVPLFEVKDRSGATVFIIYPDSARLYVGDDGSKTNKGAFAVSGRNTVKQLTHDYLKVTPDSVRVFLDSTSSKGGFAVQSFGNSQNKDYMSVYVDTAQVINPSVSRMLWYPSKEAFLSGRVLIESPDSVGTNSWATGYESKAIGNWSQALGYMPIARGDYSTAIGYNATAKGHNSYAFGNNSFSEDSASYAIGSGAQALGLRSFAVGSSGIDSAGSATNPTIASGDYSYAFGMGSAASNQGSFAFGTQDTASGQYSLAMGYITKASGSFSTAMGKNTTASGYSSSAMGYNTTASGNSSTALGRGTTASGDYSTAMGYNTTASDFYSTAMGYRTTASESRSTAMGSSTTASGDLSTAMGSSTTASGNSSTAMGSYTTASGSRSTAMGYYTTAGGSYSTAMGSYTTASGLYTTAIGREIEANGDYSVAIALNDQNGTVVSQNNTMAIMGGNVGIGTPTPDSKLDVEGDIRLNDNTFYLRGGTDVNHGLTYNSSSDGPNLFGFAGGRLTTIFGSTVALVWNSDGNVGIGTTVPNSRLHVKQSAGFSGLAIENDADTDVWSWDIGSNDLNFYFNGTNVGHWDDATGNYIVTSDKRLKKDIEKITESVLTRLMKLEVVNYRLLHADNSSQKTIGFIAQDVQIFFPDIVKQSEEGFMGLNYDDFGIISIKAIQEQQVIINELKEKNEFLLKEVTEQKLLINQLMQRTENLEKK